MKKNYPLSLFLTIGLFLLPLSMLKATDYVVSTKATLQSAYTSAVAGDNIFVANGTYDWGAITLTNTKNNSASDWITLKPQNPGGVIFTGTSTLQFSGTRILVSGFKFSGGNLGTTGVILFRSNSSTLANYCRLTDITIENQINASADTDNKWVSLYGTYNRVDHCTFDTKANAGATVTIWYSTTTYPAKAVSTYHQIDYNYFKGRTYQGSNGGESMRLGDSNSSRTDGYNIVEYNLFENMTQDEPEIVSNKSNFNTYRYNTFKNCQGGLTLRHGRYCSVYGNFFIVTASTASSYGIRVIDKGHAVYNNYIEGVKGNQGSLTSLRCPIILYNGRTLDSTDASFANTYFPATDCTIAFNTLVNCLGGAGIVLGFKESSASTFVPLNVKVANNLVKMSQGQCAYVATTGTTYTAEGNVYNAPSGLGLTSATGFTSQTLTFGSRTNGVLAPPSVAQDGATNSSNYNYLLNDLDVHGQTRSGVYDIGAVETNGSGSIIAMPLDASMVGASGVTIPVQLISFGVSRIDKSNQLTWRVENEVNFKQYEVEFSPNGKTFEKIGVVAAKKQSFYSFQDNDAMHQNGYYRLKLLDFDGQFSYSKILSVSSSEKLSLSVYPNPAQHFLIIDVNGTLSNGTEMILYDAMGKVVKTMSVTTPSQTIPLQNLAKGLYHIQLVQQNNVVATYPFIVQ